MTAILTLLFLFSLTTFVSSGSRSLNLRSSVIASIFILLGYIVSPESLGLILPSSINSMTPALRVTVFVLSFFAGLHFFEIAKVRASRLHFVRGLTPAIFMSAVIAASLFYLNLYNLLPGTPLSLWRLLGMGLILFGLFFNGWEILSVFIVALGEAAWKFQSFHFDFFNYFLAAISISVVLALSTKMIRGQEKITANSFRLAVLGLLILGTALSATAGVNEVFVGFLTGILVFQFEGRPPQETLNTRDLESPLLLFLLFFIGLHLKVTPVSLALGVVLGLVHLFSGFLIPDKAIPHADRLKIARISIPLVFSVYLSISQNLQTSFYLSVLTAGLLVTEILILQFSPTKTESVDAT